MTVISLLRGVRPAGFSLPVIFKSQSPIAQQIIREFRTSGVKQITHPHGPSALKIVPSKFMWHKFKDQFHFYFFLGVIPLGIIVFCANVFVGPATLCDIPEGYVPKQWEYYKHPIKRWMARYFIYNQQMVYERNLHYINIMYEKKRMRLMAWKVQRLMRERADYPNWYTNRTIIGKYARRMQETRETLDSETGDF